jgi:hypothetical protein
LQGFGLTTDRINISRIANRESLVEALRAGFFIIGILLSTFGIPETAYY